MTNRLHKSLIYRIFTLIIGLVALAAPQLSAFSVDTYAPSSVLNTGHWVKVSVTNSGMYRISAADLRSWGFADPSKVRVYGYGGGRISDVLSRGNYIDDLPQVQSVSTSSGVFFYAVGVESWTQSATYRFVHNLNPFTQVGYYYLTDSDAPLRTIPESNGAAPDDDDAYYNYFHDRIYHEKDLVSLSLTGHYLLGEDFRYTPSQTFTFNLIDRFTENSSQVWMQVGFAAKTYGSSSHLSFTANGTKLWTASADDIKASSSSAYIFGSETTTRKEFDLSGDKLQLGIAHSSSATIHEARLDYIAINYPRQLKLRNGYLQFWLNQSSFSLSSTTASTRVWDVTDPLNITGLTGRNAKYTNEYTGQRSYVAWDDNATLPSPKFVSNVNNQDLHSLPTPEMVIFTLPEWQSQAERLAQLHIDRDSMAVAVINVNDVYNEFSSGSPDPGAFRRLLKMFYDRGNASKESTKLKYAILMGRSIFDNRRLTANSGTVIYPTMPSWQSNTGLDENDSFTTDDFFGFLADGSGSAPGASQLDIAVGRMPVRSLEDARNAVDKLVQYYDAMPKGAWKNRVMLISDDEDRGQHMTQTERLYQALLGTQYGSELMVDKIYIDAYDKVSNGYPGARADMFRLLDEGVWWWNYVGHANMSGWTHEQFLTSNDLNQMYYRRYPILYAATCDFLRWDQANISGAEIMWQTQGGGVIAAISATRPVYISDNGQLTAQMGAQIAKRGSDGQFQRLGDIYRNAKNGLKNNSNKLRYVFMGDPAMRMTIPANRIRINSINGSPVDPADPPTIMARQEVIVEGEIIDPHGKLLPNFNGLLSTVLYDAEHSTTSHGWGEGTEVTFEQQGTRLYAGNDSITSGKFRIKIAMPSEIAHNFRPAALNMYAYTNQGDEAISCMRDLYVYGTDQNAATDTIPPVIESIYLNHHTFANGQTINESPMLLASISDNRGLNLSQAGIGHQMTLYLDETTTITDVSKHYSPNADGTIGGTIAYPLENLMEGAHTLKLRIWDTSFNFAEQTLEFFVEKGRSPVIYDIYSDANPASVEANFYLVHDRPDAQVTVTVTIYNLLGAEIWSTTTSGRSDMFTSIPVKWDLTSHSGNRVNRGIYLYKASITTDGEKHDTATRKIAVTAP